VQVSTELDVANDRYIAYLVEEVCPPIPLQTWWMERIGGETAWTTLPWQHIRMWSRYLPQLSLASLEVANGAYDICRLAHLQLAKSQCATVLAVTH
jgi:hypothetical protein